ncbi:type II methionyl aminopeptidase [Aeropyrum camini]|uniref:Methionine aminopeptidase n=1 Tax=Aeropyrum camini SY1 = JCM 12091 TaxID=1198449 RepID=U3TFV1_9CREN|nr:type II methionyl aminopeptidase [Aeropyrum camini]BAN90184.1 methionine aminopeptidase [Aeropyrum camini SY1 = JCM 12091]
MEQEPPKMLLEAGRIAAEVREYAAGLVEAGESCRRVCELVEERIRSLGAVPAFPCNISLNSVAAHYTPGLRDDCTIAEGSVVKLDVGAAVEGYIADTAVTVDLGGGPRGLVDASVEGLQAAMKVLKPGVRFYDIGRAVEQTVRRRGFKVVKNLSGHTIDRYVIHAGLSIPNYGDRTAWIHRVKPGMTFAIEPFATNGRGLVREGSTVNIYAYTGRRPRTMLGGLEERILRHVAEKYKTLPFTPRWLKGMAGDEEVERAVKLLARLGALHGYPVLIEAGGGLVAQAEHTFYALRGGVVVVTEKGQPTI